MHFDDVLLIVSGNTFTLEAEKSHILDVRVWLEGATYWETNTRWWCSQGKMQTAFKADIKAVEVWEIVTVTCIRKWPPEKK